MTPLAATPALEAWLAGALGAASATVERVERLSGGAIQESWALDVRADGAPRALVLRRDAEGAIEASRSRKEEHALVAAAWAAGVAVPRPLAFCDDAAVAGGPFALVERVAGTGYGPKVVRDARLGGDRAALGRELGRQLARIHAIAPDPALSDLLGPRPADPARAAVAQARARLDALRADRPGLEWVLRWAERHVPPPGETTLTHQDFRTGNFLVDAAGLTAILDWEFAAWSDPMADIGWFCAACWRFSRPDLEAGGLCDRAPFYEGYAGESGRAIDPGRVFWWEVMAHARWAVIALQQGQRRASGAEALSLALTARIADPVELSALRMTAPPRRVPPPPAAAAMPEPDADPDAAAAMLDAAAALLRAAAPGLAGEGRYVALLSANAVATAGRDLAARDAVAAARAALGADAASVRAGAHDGDAVLHRRLHALAALRAWVADPAAPDAAERAAFLPGRA